jgi:RNA-directed DNA polymerase
MSGKRQKTRPEQLGLAFSTETRGEASGAGEPGTETLTAKRVHESPADTERLMEEVCERENCQQALKRVKANKGGPGVDGMTVHELADYLKPHWPAIREQLLKGIYQPHPQRSGSFWVLASRAHESLSGGLRRRPSSVSRSGCGN